MKSVIDVSCGLGDMGDYLLAKGYSGIYLGLDFLEEFIDISKKKFNRHTKFQFRVFGLWVDTIPVGCDYVVLSGIFNNRTHQSKELMLQQLRKYLCRVAKG